VCSALKRDLGIPSSLGRTLTPAVREVDVAVLPRTRWRSRSHSRAVGHASSWSKSRSSELVRDFGSGRAAINRYCLQRGIFSVPREHGSRRAISSVSRASP